MLIKPATYHQSGMVRLFFWCLLAFCVQRTVDEPTRPPTISYSLKLEVTVFPSSNQADSLFSGPRNPWCLKNNFSNFLPLLPFFTPTLFSFKRHLSLPVSIGCNISRNWTQYLPELMLLSYVNTENWKYSPGLERFQQRGETHHLISYPFLSRTKIFFSS